MCRVVLDIQRIHNVYFEPIQQYKIITHTHTHTHTLGVPTIILYKDSGGTKDSMLNEELKILC